MADLPLEALNVTHFQATLPRPVRTVIEVRQKVSKLRLVLTLSVVSALALGGYVLYWWLKHGKGGFGFGFGSGKGGSSIFGQGGDPSGPGGDAAEPGAPGDTFEAGGSTSPSNGEGSASSGGDIRPTKPGDRGNGKPESPIADGADEHSDEKSGRGGDSGDDGGGTGGGSGGGVGEGQGLGDGGEEHDSVGIEDGGGEDLGEYDGGGEGLMVIDDLEPPDTSPEKIQKLRTDVEDLVLGAVLDPGVDAPELPPMLHHFDPGLGSVWKFWADVALHYNYPGLPWGRLDPDNSTHVPWIELWIDIYRYVLLVDLGENPGVEVEEPQSAVRPHALDRRGDPLRLLLWRTKRPLASVPERGGGS
ncbi:MAG: hypothetical protein KC468_22000 [Myxococcales bacterium]|nr:hypothetical protein [Myxococcales bacterium]